MIYSIHWKNTLDNDTELPAEDGSIFHLATVLLAVPSALIGIVLVSLLGAFVTYTGQDAWYGLDNGVLAMLEGNIVAILAIWVGMPIGTVFGTKYAAWGWYAGWGLVASSYTAFIILDLVLQAFGR